MVVCGIWNQIGTEHPQFTGPDTAKTQENYIDCYLRQGDRPFEGPFKGNVLRIYFLYFSDPGIFFI